MIMDFGCPEDTKAIQEKLLNVQKSVDKIERILEIAYNGIKPEDLHVKDKVNYDLFLAYALNTLYWMYLRTKGVDPNGSDVKKELTRVREYMFKAKNAIDRHTVMMRIDKPATERFINHGLGHDKNKAKKRNSSGSNALAQSPQQKKKKMQ